jgi:TPP-dependent pyruvate/acetoin dehydrogenase alpha subunit
MDETTQFIMTPQDLIKFEEQVCECFRNKQILAPIHLYYGNEENLIKIFETIRSQDWVFCTWRSHYQCLLKGVPPTKLLDDIKRGRSIALNYPEYKIFSSAIVAGNIPIATGTALAIKKLNLDEHVYCFIGDMTSETGCFNENLKYSLNHNLPITWIIEDNGLSVCTNTRKTWNIETLTYQTNPPKNVIYYQYKSKYPHAGPGGERIQF